MDEPGCPDCTSPSAAARRPQGARCPRCHQNEPRPARSVLVLGAEVIDHLGERPITRYFMALEPEPPREPNPAYLQALRRSHRRGLAS
jgi:hypothetical protein